MQHAAKKIRIVVDGLRGEICIPIAPSRPRCFRSQRSEEINENWKLIPDCPNVSLYSPNHSIECPRDPLNHIH
jgi:hypothetical protein